MTLHDLIADAIDRRLPPTPQLRAALQAALRQAHAEGHAVDSAAAAERAAAILAQDRQARRAAAQRHVTTLFVEHGLVLGATYDAEQDVWTPPAGMTFDELIAAISDQLKAAYEAGERI